MKTYSKLLQRIIAKTGVPNIIELLTDHLTGSDLQSLLLEVFQQRATQRSPQQVLAQYEKNRFVPPSSINVLTALKFETLAYQIASQFQFEPIELSPLCPLGSSSAIGTVHQNKIVTTIRNTEVMADPTNILALEASKRRKAFLKKNAKDATPVQLCTSQRVTRAQFFKGNPLFTAHFKIFCMVTAGRDTGNFQFEIRSLLAHLSFYLKLLTESGKQGFIFQDIDLGITELQEGKRTEILQKEVLDKLKRQFPKVQCRFAPERERGRGYYKDLCFHINAKTPDGKEVNLIDGGFTDWTQQFLNNKKERLLISGMGTELICKAFYKF